MKIEGGRLSFYQWDINQRLLIDNEEIEEVHFSNAYSANALVCEVYVENGSRLVNVPNILLQADLTIKAYGCCNECVREEESYLVMPREKPEDYVYTETEVKRYEDLEARIEKLEKSGAVSSVNGKTGEVKLTASDVGAVKKTGDTMTGALIGTNITLGSTINTTTNKLTIHRKVSDTQYISGSVGSSNSNLRVSNVLFTRSGSGSGYTTNSNNIDIGANNTTFSKPILFTTAEAKEDTRESLSVYSKAEVDTAIGAATAEKEFKLLASVSVDEAGIKTVEQTFETPLSEVYARIVIPAGEAAGNVNAYIYTDDGNTYYSYLAGALGTTEKQTTIYFISNGKRRMLRTVIGSIEEERISSYAPKVIDDIGETTAKVTSISIRRETDMREGTTIEIWGRE